MRKLVLGGAAALALAATPARADVTIVTDRTTQAGEKHTSTVYADPSHLRLEGTDAKRGAHTLIFDSNAKIVYVLQPAQKQYMEVTPQQLQQAGQMMQRPDVQAAMQERLASLPPEQRARIEAMMAQHGTQQGGQGVVGAAPAPAEHQIEFEATGERKTVGGFKCEGYKVKEDGKLHELVCVVPWGRATVTRDDVQAFKAMADMFKSGMPQIGGAARSYERFPGFPVERTQIGLDGKPLDTETVTAIKHGAVSADLFKLPAGYEKRVGGPFMGHGGAE